MDSLPLPRIGGFSGVLDFAIWLLGRFEFPITIFTLIRIWINGQRNKVYIPNKRHIENYPSVIYATPSHALVRGTFKGGNGGRPSPRYAWKADRQHARRTPPPRKGQEGGETLALHACRCMQGEARHQCRYIKCRRRVAATEEFSPPRRTPMNKPVGVFGRLVLVA